MRYQVREKIFSIGDDFWVTDEQGNEVFLVDGKALRLKETFELKDRSGAVVATVRKRLLALRDSMDIERDGTVIATVKKALISPLHHRSVVELPGGEELEAVGNILDKEFEIRSRGSPAHGSGCGTPTASTWPQDRMTRSSSRLRYAWTRSTTTRKSAGRADPSWCRKYAACARHPARDQSLPPPGRA
jgi:uncharacterized protein YxjI